MRNCIPTIGNRTRSPTRAPTSAGPTSTAGRSTSCSATRTRAKRVNRSAPCTMTRSARSISPIGQTRPGSRADNVPAHQARTGSRNQPGFGHRSGQVDGTASRHRSAASATARVSSVCSSPANRRAAARMPIAAKAIPAIRRSAFSVCRPTSNPASRSRAATTRPAARATRCSTLPALPFPAAASAPIETSTIWADTDFGRVGAYAIRQLVAVRSLTDPRQYTDVHEWLTNKFTNPAVRTVADFVPERGCGPRETGLSQSGGRRRRKPPRVSLGPAGVHRRELQGLDPGTVLRLCRYAQGPGILLGRQLLHRYGRRRCPALQPQRKRRRCRRSRCLAGRHSAPGESTTSSIT